MDSSVTSGNISWRTDPCLCEVCTQLRGSLIGASRAAHHADQHAQSYAMASRAVASIGDALQALHREHRPELYLAVLNIDEAKETPNKTATSQLPRQNFEARKFLVCDHCMAHGLICNEASVCEQCRNYGQPCVHRWCAESPTSEEECANSKCHYVHMDSIPHSENEPKWIILKGDLPPHLERGKLRSLAFGKHLDAYTDQVEWVKFLNSRQEDAVNIFNRAVENGEGTYTKHYIECVCAAK